MENSEGTPNPTEAAGEPKSLKPLSVTGITAVTVGTVLWTVALVVTYAFRAQLEAAGHSDWPQICAAGVILGLLGYRYSTRRARRLGLL